MGLPSKAVAVVGRDRERFVTLEPRALAIAPRAQHLHELTAIRIEADESSPTVRA
jgi:hypothetical protein